MKKKKKHITHCLNLRKLNETYNIIFVYVRFPFYLSLDNLSKPVCYLRLDKQTNFLFIWLFDNTRFTHIKRMHNKIMPYCFIIVSSFGTFYKRNLIVDVYTDCRDFITILRERQINCVGLYLYIVFSGILVTDGSEFRNKFLRMWMRLFFDPDRHDNTMRIVFNEISNLKSAISKTIFYPNEFSRNRKSYVRQLHEIF